MRSMCLTSIKVVIVKFIKINIQKSPAGVWFSPVFNGIRPPPSSTFTLTSIDNHRALLFGGGQLVGCGITSDLYLIDFDTMVSVIVLSN